MNSSRHFLFIGLGLLSLSFVHRAPAAVYSLSGGIDSSQEVPVNAATGTGTILGSYDDVSNLLSWDISFSGLTGAATGMHFHGAAGAGNNAGVQVNIGSISGLGSPTAGSTTISASQGADLVAGLWYVNIHTVANPSGEIRGQVAADVVPEPSVAFLSLIGGASVALRRRRKV